MEKKSLFACHMGQISQTSCTCATLFTQVLCTNNTTSKALYGCEIVLVFILHDIVLLPACTWLMVSIHSILSSFDSKARKNSVLLSRSRRALGRRMLSRGAGSTTMLWKEMHAMLYWTVIVINIIILIAIVERWYREYNKFIATSHYDGNCHTLASTLS